MASQWADTGGVLSVAGDLGQLVESLEEEAGAARGVAARRPRRTAHGAGRWRWICASRSIVWRPVRASSCSGIPSPGRGSSPGDSWLKPVTAWRQGGAGLAARRLVRMHPAGRSAASARPVLPSDSEGPTCPRASGGPGFLDRRGGRRQRCCLDRGLPEVRYCARSGRRLRRSINRQWSCAVSRAPLKQSGSSEGP